MFCKSGINDQGCGRTGVMVACHRTLYDHIAATFIYTDHISHWIVPMNISMIIMIMLCDADPDNHHHGPRLCLQGGHGCLCPAASAVHPLFTTKWFVTPCLQATLYKTRTSGSWVATRVSLGAVCELCWIAFTKRFRGCASGPGGSVEWMVEV